MKLQPDTMLFNIIDAKQNAYEQAVLRLKLWIQEYEIVSCRENKYPQEH